MVALELRLIDISQLQLGRTALDRLIFVLDELGVIHSTLVFDLS